MLCLNGAIHSPSAGMSKALLRSSIQIEPGKTQVDTQCASSVTLQIQDSVTASLDDAQTSKTTPFFPKPLFSQNIQVESPEEIQKRENLREQWRRNQRKCRERRRKRILDFEAQIDVLRQRILYERRLRLYFLQGLASPDPVSILHNQVSFRIWLLHTYACFFQHGISSLTFLSETSKTSQALIPATNSLSTRSSVDVSRVWRDLVIPPKILAFMEKLVHPCFELGDFHGAAALINQWKAHCILFDDFYLEKIDFQVISSKLDTNQDEYTCIIRSYWKYSLRISQPLLDWVFPIKSPELRDRLIGKHSDIRGYSDWYFNGCRAARIVSQKEFLPGFAKALGGDVIKAVEVLKDANALDKNGVFRKSVLEQYMNVRSVENESQRIKQAVKRKRSDSTKENYKEPIKCMREREYACENDLSGIKRSSLAYILD